MATYNGEKYIREQMDSILNQTIQDIELIICDDCSSDSTIDIIKEYSKKDKRIRVYKNEKNLGFIKNFEKAISLCKGEYIALSDQDDIWTPNHLELLQGALKNKVLACGNADIVDEKGNNLGMTFWEQESFDSAPSSDFGKAMSIFLYRSPYQGAAMMIKRELFSYALPIPEFAPYHDAWFAAFACFCGGIGLVKVPILKYRRIQSSVTGNRKYRRPKYLQYRNHIIWSSKLPTIRAILERVPTLNKKQKLFLNKMETICLRNNTKKGRFMNFMYKTTHYRTIYNSTLRHWR